MNLLNNSSIICLFEAADVSTSQIWDERWGRAILYHIKILHLL